ncbi:hypothetical protein BC629DRAFT_478566 [Irpex lacteus]|nr:hypothetical protein BC629DRAFT_478566 [Irpex lacteus]
MGTTAVNPVYRTTLPVDLRLHNFNSLLWINERATIAMRRSRFDLLQTVPGLGQWYRHPLYTMNGVSTLESRAMTHRTPRRLALRRQFGRTVVVSNVEGVSDKQLLLTRSSLGTLLLTYILVTFPFLLVGRTFGALNATSYLFPSGLQVLHARSRSSLT